MRKSAIPLEGEVDMVLSKPFRISDVEIAVQKALGNGVITGKN